MLVKLQEAVVHGIVYQALDRWQAEHGTTPDPNNGAHNIGHPGVGTVYNFILDDVYSPQELVRLYQETPWLLYRTIFPEEYETTQQ